MSIKPNYRDDDLVTLRQAAEFFRCSYGLLIRGVRTHQLAVVEGPSPHRTGPQLIYRVLISDARTYLKTHTSIGQFLPIKWELAPPENETPEAVTPATPSPAPPVSSNLLGFIAWVQQGLQAGYIPESVASAILKA